MRSLKSLVSSLLPVQEKPRFYIDASTFNPEQPRVGETWILTAHNEVEGIYDRVCAALRSAASVIVIDQGSTDGTAVFAAEAGAVVVMQEPGQSEEVIIQEAVRLAKRMGNKVRMCGAVLQ